MSSFRRRLLMGQHGGGVVATEYVTDGLLCHYDGIDNTDYGHDSSATSWADISGNNNHLLLSRNLSWEDNCAVFNGTSIRNNAMIDGIMCAEIVLKADSLATAYVGYFGSNCKFFAICGDGGYWTTTNTQAYSYADVTAAHTASANFSSASSAATTTGFFVNGDEITDRIRATSWSSAQSLIYFGCYQFITTSYSFHGKIYAIRFYNRNLTAAEIAQNAAVDAARFNF